MPASGLRAVKRDYEHAREAQFNHGRFYLNLQDEDLTGYWVWYVNIKGPVGSVYEGGEFDFRLWFPEYYPYKPPLAGFSTKIYHPNINCSSYGVKLNIIKSQWHPKYNGLDIINGILKAMEDPDPDRQFANDGKHLEPEIAYQFKHDREAFDRTAREWTKKVVPLPHTTAFFWERPPKPRKPKDQKTEVHPLFLPYMEEQAKMKQDALEAKAKEKQDIEDKAKEKQDNPEDKAEEKQDNPEAKAQEKQDNPEAKAQEKQDNPEAKAQERQDKPEDKAQEKKENPKEKVEEKQDNLEDKAQEKDNPEDKAQEK